MDSNPTKTRRRDLKSYFLPLFGNYNYYQFIGLELKFKMCKPEELRYFDEMYERVKIETEVT